MAVGTTSFSDLSSDTVTYIRDQLLDIAEKNVVFAQFAMMASLEQHNSKTIQFSRYLRIPLPNDPLTEGVSPASTKLVLETVTAVVDQWGLVVTLTDIAQLTVKHPLVPIVNERLGLAEAELVDREIQKVLYGSSSVTFANNKASRANLLTTDILNSVEVRKQWRTLRRNGARPYGRWYVGIVDPEVSQDIMDEDKFRAAHQFENVTALFNNEIGEWLGFRFVVSNMIPIVDLITDGVWTFASSAAGGSLPSNTYFAKITAVDNELGFEEDVSNQKSEATAEAGTGSLSITVPSTTGFTYNVYLGTTTGDSTLFKSFSNLAPSTVAVVTTTSQIGTSINPPASPPTAVPVHTSYFCGKDAFGMVKLSGMNLQVYTTPSTPSDSDPLVQRKKIGLKGAFKTLILNATWFKRLESGSAY